jgi:hypothetical protein
LYNTAHQASAGVEFRGNTVLVRDTDLIPEVAITSPAAGAVFHGPDKISLSASATVTNGSVARVEFFADDLPRLGEATNAPFSLYWLAPPAGQHSLLAIATDNFGGMAASAPVPITVNLLPAVAITSPANGATFTAPGNVAINATASDNDGAVTQVSFYSKRLK